MQWRASGTIVSDDTFTCKAIHRFSRILNFVLFERLRYVTLIIQTANHSHGAGRGFFRSLAGNVDPANNTVGR